MSTYSHEHTDMQMYTETDRHTNTYTNTHTDTHTHTHTQMLVHLTINSIYLYCRQLITFNQKKYRYINTDGDIAY